MIDHSDLCRLIAALKLAVQDDESLGDFEPDQIRKTFQTSLLMLGLVEERPSLYTLRHGGASDDLLSGARSRKEVKDRGRWQTDSSLRRYAKRTRMQQQVARMAPGVAHFGAQVEERFEELVLSASRNQVFPLSIPLLQTPAEFPPPPPPPRLTRQWHFT